MLNRLKNIRLLLEASLLATYNIRLILRQEVRLFSGSLAVHSKTSWFIILSCPFLKTLSPTDHCLPDFGQSLISLKKNIFSAGQSPVKRKCSKAPNPYTSVHGPGPHTWLYCSGGANPGVPISPTSIPSPGMQAAPKSIRPSCPESVTITLEGFRSRYMTLCLCKYDSPSANCIIHGSTSSGSKHFSLIQFPVHQHLQCSSPDIGHHQANPAVCLPYLPDSRKCRMHNRW